ncbi:unnamed protein product [Rotaria socialis]|uniref:Potassium channel tetramerisation-type BTB domain-containing protein n=1 Tax=Rotaria socialis TaxID=392032 RepID=A0A817VFQ9_9BILA|nr:unnamed protein product [Rotaria socialis]CAF3348573.1 unnamed protein product [Rotaria socialis]CAF3554036.1 unnamed protein product [Rotaria socialis]CAF3673305.1 unnamed protein product [Rotaria socialis]CAF3685142.1 unnamed protein product [Rotaria socialis]
MSDIIKFKLTNGDVFGIYRQTLERYPNSFLAKLIANEINSSFHSRDADNAFMIDEDPMIFSAILTFYRCGILTIVHDDLRQAIIDKYMLPQIYSASSPAKSLSCNDEPKYVHISFEHASSTSAQTKPHPSHIPALLGCPFTLTHTNSYRSRDPIEIANYLTCNGYSMEQMDVNTRAILMKRIN